MKKIVFVVFIMALTLIMLAGCECKHEWEPATCESPAVCKKCSATGDEPLGHTWQAATCTTPKTCKVCGKKEGSALGHTWQAATCTTPKTCKVCGKKEGSALEHTWQVATCASPKKCMVCGKTEGSKLTTHSVRQGYCSVCEHFINELPTVVDNMKTIISDCNKNMMYCKQVLNAGGSLNDAVNYYNAYFASKKQLKEIFSAYPKEFTKLKNLINTMEDEQENYTSQYNASSVTSTKRSLLSSAATAYISKETEINNILWNDYTKP